MGTNFYLKTDVCGHCGRGNERMHIGKSSAGWCFALHVIPDEGVNDLADWERLWSDPKTQIVDEYGNTLTAEEMRSRICGRRWKDEVPRRHQIDGRYCIANGADTYDLLPGEFS